MKNQKYNKFYQNISQIEAIGVVVSNKIEKEYKDVYEIQIKSFNKTNKYKNIKIYLQLKKQSKIDIKYGDMIAFKGKYIKPSSQRNYGGFDYSLHLKTLNIYGTVNCEKIEVIKKSSINPILMFSNKISQSIKTNIEKLLPETEANMLNGILLGDTEKLDEDLKERFRISNIAHILAVSGMHVSYLIMAINIVFKDILGKRNVKIISIIILIIYMFITGFSPSIVRATIMAIVLIISKLIHRKNDIWESLSFSLIIILLYNPYLITNVGLQLSYFGTIGICLFNKNILKFLKEIKVKQKKKKYKKNKIIDFIVDKTKEVLSVIISAQISILPISLFHFNYFGIYFLITNTLVTIIIGLIIGLGFIEIILSYICFPIIKRMAIILKILLNLLEKITDFSQLPFSQIYVATPSVQSIALYIFIVLIINFLYNVYHSEYRNITYIRIKNLISLFKYNFNKKKNKYIKIILGIIILIICFKLIPKNLEINFVDVGQGDSTFIITPHGNTILIDGGGGNSKEFDVGKSTLLPYILDKGYTRIDYVIISHFDNDHVGGILTIMKELKIGQIIIPEQKENSENYSEFVEIIKKKKIKVKKVKAGDRILIEKDLYFDVLWPDTEQIKENVLNNNSIVANLHYNNFSMLFTGDIEKIAEEKIIEKYTENSRILKADILKVAHHGSKTSSIEEFLKLVQTKIALIGVGANNNFGHPNEDIVKRFEELRCKNL